MFACMIIGNRRLCKRLQNPSYAEKHGAKYARIEASGEVYLRSGVLPYASVSLTLKGDTLIITKPKSREAVHLSAISRMGISEPGASLLEGTVGQITLNWHARGEGGSMAEHKLELSYRPIARDAAYLIFFAFCAHNKLKPDLKPERSYPYHKKFNPKPQ